ncbi:MAG: flagellar biosynthesis anti-sigma factor FlgM [Gammaproteobacteria bacterium]|nr:flagellar biosynthesis anti-sigma factor FlgM [Gammaproteobacteria bacterium]MDH3449434.1 flagellar biosynthesis anti-sigma factor FlgM [Gammaproteobacteria bacterium]
MTDPINTQNRLRNTGVSTDARAGSADKADRQSARGKSAAGKADDSDKVQLSGAARIDELSEQIKNLPQVNEARVEAVKQALTKGEYQPDAEVIARKYSEIEKLLP